MDIQWVILLMGALTLLNAYWARRNQENQVGS
mgnify:CR=1 FL=1